MMPLTKVTANNKTRKNTLYIQTVKSTQQYTRHAPNEMNCTWIVKLLSADFESVWLFCSVSKFCRSRDASLQVLTWIQFFFHQFSTWIQVFWSAVLCTKVWKSVTSHVFSGFLNRDDCHLCWRNSRKKVHNF